MTNNNILDLLLNERSNTERNFRKTTFASAPLHKRKSSRPLIAIFAITILPTILIPETSHGQQSANGAAEKAFNAKHQDLSRSSIKFEPYHPVDHTQFRKPSDAERIEIESFLLELELSIRIANKIGCTASGQYFFFSREPEQRATSIKYFSMGWVIDNQNDAERIILTNQEQLVPIRQHPSWTINHSQDISIDQIRLGRQIHEANGPAVFPVTRQARLTKVLKNMGLFFPMRAVISHPLDCWSGRAVNHRQEMMNSDRLTGVQKHGKNSIALFHFTPTDFYDFFVTIYFKEGLPIQTDFWRYLIAPKEARDQVTQDPIPERLGAAVHVATTRTQWKKYGENHFPRSLQSWTNHDTPKIELHTDLQWIVNEQINESVFDYETCGKISPFEFSSLDN